MPTHLGLYFQYNKDINLHEFNQLKNTEILIDTCLLFQLQDSNEHYTKEILFIILNSYRFIELLTSINAIEVKDPGPIVL